VVGFTTGSRGEVSGKRKSMIREHDDDDDDDDDNGSGGCSNNNNNKHAGNVKPV
jgi:hypothetical protein